MGEVPITSWGKADLLRSFLLEPLLATIEKGLVLLKMGRLDGEDRQAPPGVLDDILER